MAMTPEEKTEFETLKAQVHALMRVEDVQFIENVKRRASGNLREDGTSSASSIVQSVSEGGASSYDVCAEPDTKLKIITASGTVYYIPAFNS